jgi:hypothetical protein
MQWVSREPRAACPWLVRRFIDPVPREQGTSRSQAAVAAGLGPDIRSTAPAAPGASEVSKRREMPDFPAVSGA